MTLMAFERGGELHRALVAFTIVVGLLALPQAYVSLQRVGPAKDLAYGNPLGTNSNIRAFHEYEALEMFAPPGSVVMVP